MNKDIEAALANTAEIIGMPFYWLDINNKIIGANNLTISAMGAVSTDSVIGKTPYDLYPYNLAHAIVLHRQAVISSGETLVVEESIKNIATGAIQYYTATIWPLCNENGKIIGTVGTSTDITAKKNADKLDRKEKVLTHFARLTEILPIYWLDTQQRYVDVNSQCFKAIRADFGKEYLIGKTPLDIYPEAMARDIMDHHSDVVRTGNVFRGEEVIVDMTGKIAYFDAIVGPLRDDDGNIIGTIGTSINITAQKEAQNEKVRYLQLENELHQINIKRQNSFRNAALKIAHDINSPLAALNMMLETCKELPEDKRSFLRQATESILDIANNLLTHNDDKDENGANSKIEIRQPLLVSDLLHQLLSEKRVQYQEYPITFETVIADDAQFAFIQAQKIEFRRSMSNLINNAVDALIDKEVGAVTIHLTADADSVVVKVEDNGMGMPRKKVEKILAQQGFTEGKENGHGIGLPQIWEMLESNHGNMAVQSTPGKGTSIQLTFARVAASEWIAQKINLVPENIIVVLDDDASIHHAWDLRFNPFLAAHPSLRLHHFTQGQDVLDFVDKLNSQEKSRVAFLSDYELLHQMKNGLQIIEASQVRNSTLVTSYYANPKIRDAATQLGVKILPKQMAAIIPIDSD